MATQQTTEILSTLVNTEEFVTDPKALALKDAIEAYLITHATEEAAKARREAIRDVLLTEAKANGKDNEKGGQRLVVEGHTVLRERRMASTPDEKKLLALLESKGLAVEEGFDKVTILQPNPSKVTMLVDAGLLSEEEGKSLYRETFACVVHPNRDIEALLENALPAVEKKSRSRR